MGANDWQLFDPGDDGSWLADPLPGALAPAPRAEPALARRAESRPTDAHGNVQLRPVAVGEQFGVWLVVRRRYYRAANVWCRCLTCGREAPLSVEGLLLGHFDSPCVHLPRGEPGTGT
jgi:hypothetical protein